MTCPRCVGHDPLLTYCYHCEGHRGCTWLECTQTATTPHMDKHGKIWAHLCPEHHARLERVLADANPKAILSVWVLAQGGSKAIMDDGRFAPATEAAARLFTVLDQLGKRNA